MEPVYPRQYAYRTYCSHGLCPDATHAMSVGVGNLDEQLYDGHYQREKLLAVDGALCQILCSLHVDRFLGKQCCSSLFRFLRRRWQRFCLYFRILAYTSQMKRNGPKTAKISVPVLRLRGSTSRALVPCGRRNRVSWRSVSLLGSRGYCTGSICRLSAPGRGRSS